ncbi:MAG: primosomal protein N' [Clostridia bacterium]|nr:primosomal protein N' [Clostridia bacterium]
MPGIYARVRILDVPFHGDRSYEYYIPPALSDSVFPGSLVNVSFGHGSRRCAAIVTDTSNVQQGNYELKPISSVESHGPLLTPEEMAMCNFMCGYTLCTFGEAVRCIVPSAALSKFNFYYRVIAEPSEAKKKKLPQTALRLYSHLCTKEKASQTSLQSNFGEGTAADLTALLKAGLIEKEAEIKSSTNIKYITEVKLKVSPEQALENAKRCLRSPLQAAILEKMAELAETDSDTLFAAINAKATVQLSSLAKKGLLELTKKEVYRNPYADAGKCDVYNNTSLTEEQRSAVDKLKELSDSGEAKAALLHGVTGSGKTRVIKEMIDEMTKKGRGVIILVPEIALTPQTVGIFCSCYGDRVAVIHSALSQGEKYDSYRRIRQGEADIVIGTRSAVFAPVKDLGMIVIDEEQEHTYKSDTDPKYHARDIASYRCGKAGALMLLASATPSLSSYHKAKNGIYTLIELKNRYGNAVLPKVVISDMRLDRDTGNPSPVGLPLYNKLLETVKDKKQAIVFLNRRGYNSFVSCRICGEAIKCPHCSVSLTYHTHRTLGAPTDRDDYMKRRIERGSLACHYCGYKVSVPQKCPTCSSEHFRFAGCGTQQAEEELSKLIPGARIARMDMDTTGSKLASDKILEDFREKRSDILIGTQMVTKGHDFPDVTLVGVMNADSSLFLDDYRASERTFDMLTQVVGRAGRGRDPGVAVIQTCNPDSPIIKLAAAQDYKTFYENEINVRRALNFPPFCDIAAINMTCSDESLLGATAKVIADKLKGLLEGEYKDISAEMYGPFEAPVYKVQNCFRMRIILKLRLSKRSRAMIATLLHEVGTKANKKINVTADLNPTGL